MSSICPRRLILVDNHCASSDDMLVFMELRGAGGLCGPILGEERICGSAISARRV